MSELRGLTGARGIAAWWVVLYHLRGWLDVAEPVRAALAKGYLAVDFFFLLSGFVIWLSYAERLREGGWRAVPDFLRRRIARIWPLHLAMLGYALLLAALLYVTGRPPDPRFALADLPWHAVLLQAWGGRSTLYWNDPAWSISAEMFAYVLFPLLAMTIDWRRVPTVWLPVAVAAILGLLATIMAARGLERLGDSIPEFALVRCSLEFVAGTVVAALWHRFREARPRALPLAIIAAALATITFLAGPVVELAVVPAAFAGLLLILAIFANAGANPLASRQLHYLGEISFATYLSHSLLWKTVTLALVHGKGPVPWSLAAAYLMLVLVASIALYHGIERPAQRWINRRRWPGGDARRAAARP